MTTDAVATTGKAIAILVADGFEESQLTDAQRLFLEHGLEPKVVGQEGILVHGWHEGAWGHHFMTDARLSEVLSADYAALLLPDGPQSAATLARDPHAKRLVKAFVETDKPVAVLGHAVTLLRIADVVSGRQVTGAEAVREDITIAGGATWSDGPLAVDGNLITAADGRELSHVLAALMTKTGEPVPQVDQAA